MKLNRNSALLTGVALKWGGFILLGFHDLYLAYIVFVIVWGQALIEAVNTSDFVSRSFILMFGAKAICDKLDKVQGEKEDSNGTQL